MIHFITLIVCLWLKTMERVYIFVLWRVDCSVSSLLPLLLSMAFQFSFWYVQIRMSWAIYIRKNKMYKRKNKSNQSLHSFPSQCFPSALCHVSITRNSVSCLHNFIPLFANPWCNNWYEVLIPQMKTFSNILYPINSW